MSRTIKSCLVVIAPASHWLALTSCNNLEEEWSVVKKAYFKKIRAAHPDRGGVCRFVDPPPFLRVPVRDFRSEKRQRLPLPLFAYQDCRSEKRQRPTNL
jgi:hypothetical protein